MANIARDALWDSGHDESVEVNQRALIDKVLARYSGEFTVFRELLQNSDDAQATSVEIRFETKDYVDRVKGSSAEDHANESTSLDLKASPVHQWVFKNNGIKFREEDWSRLKKIAEGNPDEEKIGAFGVGFYSLFSVTEEPFVTSGDQWMGFYWKDKKDQLFARRGSLPSSSSLDSPWTTFEMVLREPAPIPIAFDFTRFLASSITFMTHLREVSLFFDDTRLAYLKKTPGVPQQIVLPKGLRSLSASGMMNVKGLQSTSLHIQAKVLHLVYTSGSEKKSRPAPAAKPKLGGFFSSLFTSIAGSATPQRSSTPIPSQSSIDPLDVNETSVTLSVFSAEVDVKLNKKISAELFRSTKKNPPTKVKYELIYTAKDEYDKSKKEDDLHAYSTGSIFQGLRADLDGSGATRIFIGHATGQTTGLGGHMACRFIPTVERESIDLMDRNVALWNKDLLSVGGFLARAAYDRELDTIKNLWDGASTSDSTIDADLQNWLRSRCVHALKFFTFHPSTPSNDVSTLLESAFFSCDAHSTFPLISNVGVRSGSEIRLPDPAFKDFLKHLPVLPDDVLADASSMIATLQNRGMIKNITFDDVLKELQARPLTQTEMVACLKWWIGLSKQAAKVQHGPRTQFLDAAILLVAKTDKADEKIIPLSSVRSFINSKSIANIIPLDGPLPSHLLPTEVSRNLPPDELGSAFPWSELTIPQWLHHLCSPPVRKSMTDYDITLSAAWAERVLSIIARTWTNLSQSSKNEIQACFKNLACIPTSSGMKTPEQAYFASANIFNDLPVVTFPSGTAPKGQMERVLQAIGVRRHVELQVIFNRMIKTNEWTVADLVKYLVSVESTLSDEERSRLKVTAAFCKEQGDSGSSDQKPTRSQAQQLYEPTDALRQLGLPILDWGKQHKWRSSSDEARFLFDQLGLKRYPPLPVLINICASTDTKIRHNAFKYLLDHMHTHYKDYEPSKYNEIAFIPSLSGSEACLGTLKEVVWNPDWANFGFLVTSPSLQPDAVAKLKISQHPTSHRIVEALEKKPPTSEAEARTWFSILSARISDFSSAELQRLSQMKIVPVPDKKEDVLRYHAPSKCYLGGDAQVKFHSRLFVFVNFGQPANGFLTACGTKHEPSVDEVALVLLENPYEFYQSAEGPTQFLSELRNLAVNQRMVKSATISRMRTAPILLGSRRKARRGDEKADPEDYEDDLELEYDLKKPSEIVIADDTHALQAFGDSLFIAPQEDILEAFYAELGSKRLSALVIEDYQTTSEIRDSKTALDIRGLVLERLPLFLHEHSHARTRVTYSWLTSPDNFTVKTYGKLTINKSLTFGDLRLSRKQDASALARRPSKYGAIELAIAGNAQIDMYEVALSLNRLIFESPRANDALLFMTILSTDLKALKRRGYNVDRILRQQQAQRAAMAAKKAEKAELLSKAQYDGLDSPTSPPPLPEKDSSSLSTANSTRRPVPAPLPAANSIKKLFSRKPSLAPELPPVIPPPSTGPPPEDNKPTNTKGTRATPLRNIASNIDMAVKACRPESGNLLRNREEMRQIRESLNEGYCDISGRVGDLNRVGEVGKIKIYLSYDVPDQREFVPLQKDSISRFVYLVTKLARVYDVPLTSMHIFYDLGGTLIAFNRNGSIFLNLRYYQEWHDSEVLAGNLNTAYISWYFTLAHEIAHNLVQPHNSEHEFYFSAICEKHLMNLGQLLAA